jgi:serine protease Do
VPGSFSELARRSNPAVVFVRTLTASARGFRRELREGSGSGFVFDSAGLILTNFHVVEGARAIQVEFFDGRALEGRVVGVDPHTDVAVLSVAARGLPALPLGDSEAAAVGDWVIAIGNPFGLEHTVSAGIISAKERTTADVQLDNPGAYYSFLQTDASINPGNSGGPLIDTAGRVVGMNTAINAAASGIGFAIPVDMLRDLLPRLLEKGRVERAVFGLQVAPVGHEEQARLRLADRRGALVVGVVPVSPASEAGLLPGDVVIGLDGQATATPERFRWRASLAAVGRPARLSVLRGGQHLEVNATPVAMR